MPILDRIRVNGGDVVRDEYRMRLVVGKLSASALEWLRRPEVREAVHREVFPEVDEWHERAAIREFDGGQDREAAEREAYREVMARV